MGIIRLNDLPDGSGSLSNDDIFIFMDDPSGSGITKKISLSQISLAIGGGGGGSEVNDLTSIVTWANVPDANITESSVVQHSGALKITESQIVDLQNYFLSSNFNTSVSGLLPVKNVLGSGNINVTSSSEVFTISSSGLVKSDITGISGASGVNNLVYMSQVDYDNLATTDPNTIYFIV